MSTARLVFLTTLLFAHPLFAQNESAQIAPDETITIVTVPKLLGAVFFQADVGRRFQLGGDLPTVPVSFGGGIGWRQFLEGHGRTQLRLAGAFEYGVDQFQKADQLYVGGELGIGLRAYSDLFAFVGSTLSFTGGYFSYGLDESGDFLERTTHHGAEFGLKYDISFGSIAWSAPYLFVEAALSLALKYANYGPYSGFFLGGQWTLRFDWAFKDQKFYKSPDRSKWE